jgi:hypothetical protein
MLKVSVHGAHRHIEITMRLPRLTSFARIETMDWSYDTIIATLLPFAPGDVNGALLRAASQRHKRILFYRDLKCFIHSTIHLVETPFRTANRPIIARPIIARTSIAGRRFDRGFSRSLERSLDRSLGRKIAGSIDLRVLQTCYQRNVRLTRSLRLYVQMVLGMNRSLPPQEAALYMMMSRFIGCFMKTASAQLAGLLQVQIRRGAFRMDLTREISRRQRQQERMKKIKAMLQKHLLEDVAGVVMQFLKN